MHWADVAAKALIETAGRDKDVRLATGITPSGPIHIGNMREILTADMVARGLRGIGKGAEVLYICDSIDPLRRVYPFLDPAKYESYVGWPLYRIPCPCGGHENYAEHFLEPFLWSLEKLGVDVKVLKTHELYKSGKYYPAIKIAMERRDEIRAIIKEVSGRSVGGDWWPYNPICGGCGSMQETRVTGFEDPYVHYVCEKCGHSGRADIRTDDGKLPWRVDWPARWWFLGVDFEPFGKDHATAGGSYDTGSAIAEQIYGIKPPSYVVYEWIHLKGKGAMSSSKGTAVPAHELLEIVPPEVMRFIIARVEPKKHINFDPALPLLDIVDEFDRYERVYFDLEEMGGKATEDLKRIYELSHIGDVPDKERIVQVPFRHLVTLVQIYGDEETITQRVAQQIGVEIDEEFRTYVKVRVACVRRWLDVYAPDSVRFSIITDINEIKLNEEDRRVLEALADVLENIEWRAESIHNGVYDCAAKLGIKAPKVFRAAYRALIGSDRGPRLGYFLSSLDRSFVMARLRLKR